MELGQLQGFLAIARTANLTHAADELYISQPALTARLRGLERELGAELFVRAHRGMRLTEAGKAFVPHAERCFAAIDDGRREVDAVVRGERGELTLGAAPAVSTYVLPGVLKRFTDEHPNVRLTVRTGHSEELLALVLANQVQLALTRELHHNAVEALPVYEDRLQLVVNASHRFASRRKVKLAELAAERLVLFDETSSYHELTQALFLAAGVEPAGQLELDNIDAAKQMVREGLGVAFLPRSAIAREVGERTLVRVAVSDAEPVRRQIVALRLRDSPPVAAVTRFLALLRDVVGESLSER